MTRFLFAASAALALICAAGTASAQIAPGLSGSSTMRYIEGSEVWDVLSTFGTCYAQENRTDAFALIASDPGSKEEAETYKRLFSKPYQSCLRDVTSLPMPPALVRGAIAEGLYKKHLPIPANLLLPILTASQIHNLTQAARCYTASHREEVRSLLATHVGSAKELAAVTGMMPDFSRCVPAGADARAFDATLVRFRLAEALLRSGPDPVPVVGGKN